MGAVDGEREAQVFVVVPIKGKVGVDLDPVVAVDGAEGGSGWRRAGA